MASISSTVLASIAQLETARVARKEAKAEREKEQQQRRYESMVANLVQERKSMMEMQDREFERHAKIAELYGKYSGLIGRPSPAQQFEDEAVGEVADVSHFVGASERQLKEEGFNRALQQQQAAQERAAAIRQQELGMKHELGLEAAEVKEGLRVEGKLATRPDLAMLEAEARAKESGKQQAQEPFRMQREQRREHNLLDRAMQRPQKVLLPVFDNVLKGLKSMKVDMFSPAAMQAYNRLIRATIRAQTDAIAALNSSGRPMDPSMEAASLSKMESDPAVQRDYQILLGEGIDLKSLIRGAQMQGEAGQ